MSCLTGTTADIDLMPKAKLGDGRVFEVTNPVTISQYLGKSILRRHLGVISYRCFMIQGPPLLYLNCSPSDKRKAHELGQHHHLWCFGAVLFCLEWKS